MSRTVILAHVNSLCFIRLTVRVWSYSLTPFPYWCANSRSHSLARPLYMIIFPGLISRCTYRCLHITPKAANYLSKKITTKTQPYTHLVWYHKWQSQKSTVSSDIWMTCPEARHLVLERPGGNELAADIDDSAAVVGQVWGALPEFWPRKPFRLVDDGIF